MLTKMIKKYYFCFLVLLSFPVSGLAGEPLFEIIQTKALKMMAQDTGLDTPNITLNNKLRTSSPGDEFNITGDSGNIYTIVFDNFLPGRHSRTWVGHLKNYGHQYRVFITFNKKEVIGYITTPEAELRLQPSKSGLTLKNYKKQGMLKAPFGYDMLLPETTVPEANPDAFDVPLSSETTNTHTAGSTTNSAANNSASTTVDVLVLYNSDFQTRLENDGSSASTRIDFLTALMNQALIDSQVNMQIRIVGMKQINYSETNSNTTALSDISSNSEIATLRENKGADLVVLIRPYKRSAHGNCGYAMLNSSLSSNRIFATVSDGIDVDYSGSGSWYYCKDSTFAHELGHTMGLAHNTENTSSHGSHSYSYGYGHNGSFGTIMSYFSPKVHFFSNPDISTCNNSACGTANANNALSLNTDRVTIGNFRDEVIPQSANLNPVYYLLFN